MRVCVCVWATGNNALDTFISFSLAKKRQRRRQQAEYVFNHRPNASTQLPFTPLHFPPPLLLLQRDLHMDSYAKLLLFLFLDNGKWEGKGSGAEKGKGATSGAGRIDKRRKKKTRHGKLKNYRGCTFTIVIFETSNSIVCKNFSNLGT